MLLFHALPMVVGRGEETQGWQQWWERERNGQIKSKVVHVFLNIPWRSSFTILLTTVLLRKIMRWVMTEPPQQEARRFQCARKWRAMRLLGIYWWGVAATIKALQCRWNWWTSLSLVRHFFFFFFYFSMELITLHGSFPLFFTLGSLVYSFFLSSCAYSVICIMLISDVAMSL